MLGRGENIAHFVKKGWGGGGGVRDLMLGPEGVAHLVKKQARGVEPFRSPKTAQSKQFNSLIIGSSGLAPIQLIVCPKGRIGPKRSLVDGRTGQSNPIFKTLGKTHGQIKKKKRMEEKRIRDVPLLKIFISCNSVSYIITLCHQGHPSSCISMV